MLTVLPGIQNSCFTDINKMVGHSFPEEIINIGFSVTLLHNHSHAPPNSFLVYSQDFSEASYLSSSQLHSFYPCSWYLNETSQPIAYEFSSKAINYDEDTVLKQLMALK
jgi:hypothetical protein